MRFALLIAFLAFAGATFRTNGRAAPAASDPVRPARAAIAPAREMSELPRVAVLVERGLMAYGGTPSLPPNRIVETLAAAGIRADALSAGEAADPDRLSADRYDVLVLPYGNAFPEPALANLRAFHAAGGNLVTAGIPFTHPSRKENGTWRDMGHRDFFGHDANGMGTGGFGGPSGESALRATVPANPLGLKTRMLASRNGRWQWLDESSLPGEDETIPLITARAGGKRRMLSALVRHRCPPFRGARVVWIGQVASGMEMEDRYLAEQIVTRGVLWCLREKGVVTAAAFRRQLARLDRVPYPKPPPAKLAYRPAPRPWGESFVPRSSPPARRLTVVDVSRLSAEEKIALTCLQGLTSRKQPYLWLIRGVEDRWWLDWHVKKGHFDGYDEAVDWTALFRKHAGEIRGAVAADSALYRGDLLAANVAACENMIVAPPALAERLGIPVRIDLRGRFGAYADGLRWVWRTYRDRFSRHVCNFMHPMRLSNCVFSYEYQWRGLMFWIAGPVDASEPGADPVLEKRAMAEIFAEMAPNSPVMGFPYAGEGVGIGEVDGVGLASRYAVGLVCTDFLGNLPVTSGVRIGSLAQTAQPPAPPLERDRIYIALVMSDGDNQNTWIGFFKRYFEHPAFGTFPLAFGMGPPILELQPAVAQWYFERATPGTEFIADVSGVAYIHPEEYGKAYRDRNAVWSGFLGETSRTMRAMGMRSVRTVGGGDPLIERYAKSLPFVHSVFADMGRYSGREGIDRLTYSMGETPVFRAVTGWGGGKEGFLPEVRSQVGTKRPAFVNGFVHCWTFDMDSLARIVASKDADMVFVTPSQLAKLYREAREKGWVK